MPEERKNFKIRDFKAEDLSDILKVERESFEHPWSKKLLEKEAKLPFSTILVAEKEKVSGYLLGWIVGETGEVHRIAVLKEERGRGIATALMEEFLRRCAEARIKEVFLEVNSKNEPALELYRKFGFKEVRRRKSYYGKEEAIEMKLTIQGGKNAQRRKP